MAADGRGDRILLRAETGVSMRSIRRALARMGATLRGHHGADDDLRAEMEAHLQMAIDENVRRGMRPEEARRQAMIASGGLTQAAESVREQRGLPWVESVAADVRHAVRHFRRTPLSTVTMVLVLSLGISTNVVLFTLLNSLATLPAPGIARDESLVRIRGTMRTQGVTGAEARLMSWPEVQEYAGRTDLFSSVAAYADETAVVGTGDAASPPVTANLVYTTSNYFSVLGIRPALGTQPAAEAGGIRMATSPTAMISHAMWRQRFGGAPDVIGRTLRVNDVPVEVVGVAPPRFVGTDGGGAMTLWVPLAAYPLLQQRTAAAFTSYDSMFLNAAARLRPGATARTATPIVAGMAERALRLGRDGAATQAAGAGPVLAQGVAGSADVVPMLASNSRVSQRADLLVSVAVSVGFALLVLLITCTNVSALMVGLAAARRREIGVRLSLGAPRRRLVRQLLTESVLLALVAAAVGLFVTVVGIRLAGASLADVQLVVDWRVTAATCAVAIATGVLFGVSPALHATRVSVGEVLKSSSPSVAATRSVLQRALVVAQITLTQPLLVGLGVVAATMATDLDGRAPSGVPGRIAEIELDTWAGRVSAAERASRIAAAVERVAAMPGVLAAMPMQMGTTTVPLTVHPADRVAGVAYDRVMEARLTAAPEGYFGAFEIPIVRGRDFDAGEYAHSPDEAARLTSIDAVIIGSDLARRLWGGADPLGRRLAMALAGPSTSPPMVVVGVVDEAAAGPSDVNGQIRVYVPYAPMSTGVVARTAGPALPMLGAMREAVAAEAPQMPVYRAQTMEQREAQFRRSVLRASGAVAGGGLLALLLSAIGLYAVVSFGVAQRTREIGIRTALGAQRGQVVRTFFAKGLALSAVGLVLGLPLSMLATRLVAAALSWPLASSPLIGVAIGAVVLVVASVAVWIPARRASTIDPMVALRTE
ncbi:MAG TPA: FtsX-like permease family protein [Longimicrobiaceae bacterium]|nr:FtsX-like permease family protein [Longimicrobiaceae bacterium]